MAGRRLIPAPSAEVPEPVGTRCSIGVSLAFLIAIAGCLLAGCQSHDAVPTAHPNQPLRVGTSGDYAPFSCISAEGRFKGFEIELARRYGKDRDLEIEFVHFRWPELLGDLASNRFDVAMSGVTVRPERTLAGRFTVPLAISGAVAIVPSNSVARSVAELDQHGARVAVNAGGHLERVARRCFTHARIVVSPDNERLPDLLERGECDAIVSDTLEAPHWVARVQGARVLGPFTRDTKAWLVRKEEDGLAAQLDRWLIDRERDGTVGRLRQHHLGAGSKERTAEPLAALSAAVDERLALMPLVAESKRHTGRPIEDRAQEERVVAAALEPVQKEARKQNCGMPNEKAVEAFFRAQIQAAKAIQGRALPIEDGASEESAPDLAEELRPALARIGERMARLIVELGTEQRRGVAHPEMIREQTVAVLDRHGLPPAHLDAIADALIGLTTRSEPGR